MQSKELRKEVKELYNIFEPFITEEGYIEERVIEKAVAYMKTIEEHEREEILDELVIFLISKGVINDN